MLTVRKILCPVDFSDASRVALDWAVALASQHQCRLTVLTAVDPLLATVAQARFKQDLRTETAPVLQAFVTANRSSTHVECELDVQVGQAPDVILEASTRHGVDLVVMGTLGIGGVRKLLLGSTTERVLRRTLVPILAVPPAEVHSSRGPQDSTPAVEIETVLAATDFSEPSQNAIRWATDFAQAYGALLLLTHVVTPLTVPLEWTGYVEGINDERLIAARARLEELSAGLGAGVRVETLVTLGRSAASIAATAEARQVDLVVMGLTGTERVLAPRPGSTAYGVLTSVHSPVLVIPPDSRS